VAGFNPSMSKIAILEQMNGIGGDGMRNENNRTRLLYTTLTMTVHVKANEK